MLGCALLHIVSPISSSVLRHVCWGMHVVASTFMCVWRVIFHLPCPAVLSRQQQVFQSRFICTSCEHDLLHHPTSCCLLSPCCSWNMHSCVSSLVLHVSLMACFYHHLMQKTKSDKRTESTREYRIHKKEKTKRKETCTLDASIQLQVCVRVDGTLSLSSSILTDRSFCCIPSPLPICLFPTPLA